MNPKNKFQPIIVFTTSDQKNVLEKIAQAVVEKKIAACVQVVGPITSCYRWNGSFEKSQEWLCKIKSAKHVYSELEREISALHNYEVPEITAIDICQGSDSYFDWMGDNLRQYHDSI